MTTMDCLMNTDHLVLSIMSNSTFADEVTVSVSFRKEPAANRKLPNEEVDR